MNSIVVVVLSLAGLVVGYVFYGKLISKIWDVDFNRKTPAVEQYDGVDYVPAKSWVMLFGHHFASIAGAGPILGPVIACAIWGWVPALVWIVLGSVLIGGVHDFSSLMISLRYKGKSIADITSGVISNKARLVFASFVWLALILVVAVFTAVTAQTLVEEPRIVIPTFGLIFNAIFLGLMIYRWKVNQVLATLIGLVGLFFLLFLGKLFPVKIDAISIWICILLLYCFIASIIPVNILLQPRDYLSFFILVFGLLFGYIGVFMSTGPMHTPGFISWTSKQGALVPMLFVFIACGAISGFHSLISSGTTSKQLPNERYARRIGYGGMIMEGVLGVLAVVVVCAGLYWKQGADTNGLVYPELMKKGGWILTFATGFGNMVKPLFGMSFGMLIASTILNSFVMTTLDSATRINRYITEELFGDALKISFFKNRYISTLFVVVSAGCLAFGNYKVIWPIFGASNQLISALVLLVVTTFLFCKNKPIKYTFYPGIIMLITSIWALVFSIHNFINEKKILLSIIGVVLLLLAVFMVIEAVKAIRKHYLVV